VGQAGVASRCGDRDPDALYQRGLALDALEPVPDYRFQLAEVHGATLPSQGPCRRRASVI
jgi:hypothetical protein